MATKGYVFITVAAKETKNALKKLRALNSVQSAEGVTGPYDIIATVEAPDTDILGQMVTEEIQNIEGIERTLTCIVMKL